ncbi:MULTISPECIES: HlyD family efflux transporter periplasmic adaptor subunit [unclassified Lysobacter]|uniref:HlyD family secretion protein n=1 Tax=unclassified Lysobacter TaxID=2635362 RepID=UPI001BE8927C|nr:MULTISPECIES: HlyD family efflux transporter periplasmic adaptor subunit [unclassified Lysobacter]MBT2748622.1 HlyD family efflux transporter periplasmic adaptor subunit [Lysobacter sp. ISL-42]MBT2751557.1 HlyD family efflux transporter periplasmic adaptor subunit [Lysobacter sp. ISL-50]MBT2775751.1 HlyD family efflux transporter periplasmic adaptor subunit [Lysobacter sp. ISL-54]MBT2782284.1 HlyD family efflux transporter periplasmic adaptor subunit [Lysobacter sp. ISL-52]
MRTDARRRDKCMPSAKVPARPAIAPWLIALLVLAGCQKEPVIEGRVEFRELNLAAKYPGRLLKLHVDEGQHVDAGALIAEIVSPEAQAKRQQADALVAGAEAQQVKADEGARKQELSVAAAGVATARAQAELMRTTEGRMQRLFKEGVVPHQRLDEAIALRRSADAALEAARATLSLIQEGLRKEDKDTAAAFTAGAKGLRQEVEAALDETHIRAPASGQIVDVFIHEGEIVAAGFPVAVLAVSDAPWVSFNVREDQLTGLKVGQRLTARIPAIGEDDRVDFVVERISVLGDYATWRSTRDLGSYDLHSFEVRARPAKPVTGLRAGMSVLVPLAQLQAAR